MGTLSRQNTGDGTTRGVGCPVRKKAKAPESQPHSRAPGQALPWHRAVPSRVGGAGDHLAQPPVAGDSHPPSIPPARAFGLLSPYHLSRAHFSPASVWAHRSQVGKLRPGEGNPSQYSPTFFQMKHIQTGSQGSRCGGPPQRPLAGGLAHASRAFPGPADTGILAVTSLRMTPLPRELSLGRRPACPETPLGLLSQPRAMVTFPGLPPPPASCRPSCSASVAPSAPGRASWAGARKPRGRPHLPRSEMHHRPASSRLSHLPAAGWRGGGVTQAAHPPSPSLGGRLLPQRPLHPGTGARGWIPLLGHLTELSAAAAAPPTWRWILPAVAPSARPPASVSSCPRPPPRPRTASLPAASVPAAPWTGTVGTKVKARVGAGVRLRWGSG